MSTIIIITPPTKPQAQSDDVDGFAQARSDYAIARDIIDEAEAAGARIRVVEG